MTWFSKVCFFSAMLLVSVGATAQRVDFNRTGTKAGLETRLINNSRSVSAIEVHLSIPHLDVNKQNDGFDEVLVPGLSPLGVVGSPSLFTTGSLIAVPEGYQPEVTVVNSQEAVVPNVSVAPTQRKCRCESPKDEAFAFNGNLYRSNGEFPARAYGVEEVGRLQGLKLARIAFYPVRMDMGTKSLKVTTDVTLRVSFRQIANGVRPVHLAKPFYEMALGTTVNAKSFDSSLLVADNAETMLVITADTLKTDIAPLVAWKQAKGFHVDVVTFTEAGGSKESVKKYIQDYYDKAEVKPSFLLFVGNKTTMPPYFESTSSGNAATDYTFALLSGDDNIPDVAYGRIVADNAEDVATQVNRSIAYEKSPQVGADWYNKGMGIASNEGSGPSDKEYAQQIATTLKSHTYKEVDGFFQGDGTATSSNISSALNDGRSWIAYFGHGSGTSWGSTNDTFNVSTVGTLTNDDRLPVIIDVACQNASWANIAKSFGKAWVTRENGGKAAGAVAFLGGSVNISWHPPAIMSVGIAKYHFEKSIHSLGSSVLAGQLYLIEQKGNTSETIDNLKWYNLLGDPSLEMRTDAPKDYDVKASLRKRADGVTITVKAADLQGAAVAGLKASVHTATSASLVVGVTAADGTVELNIPGVGQLEPNTLLTTTGYNLASKETNLE